MPAPDTPLRHTHPFDIYSSSSSDLACWYASLFGIVCRLLDIVHADQKLYLVFEFLDVDLKKYMELGNNSGQPISLDLCKVSCIIFGWRSSGGRFSV